MNIRFSILLGIIVSLPIGVLGQGTYYNSINPAASSFVTDLESRIRTPYTRISYDNYKTTIIPNFESRDTTVSRKVVTCIYSGLNYVYTPPFAWIGGAGVSADSGFSREHTWCQSWMPTVNASGFSNMPEYSDQHHLFPVNQNNANGVRSNHPLSNVVSVSSTYINAKFGTNAAGMTVYEPRAEHKGDAARALLYMTVRYNGIGGYTWTFNNLNRVLVDSLSETTQDLATLLQWHLQDPPNKWEVDRNTYIESVQGNRNPFIDHPEYVNYINFADLTKLSPTYATEPTNQPTNIVIGSITNSSLTVSWTASVTGSQSPSGYMVEIYNSNDYFIPIDGSAYADDTNLSDTKGIVNVASGTTSVTFSGLSASSTYYFRIYPYNGSSTSINYKLDGTVLSANGTTASGAVTYATEPANHPTNLTAGTVTATSIGLTWTASVAGAQAPSGYLLLANTTGTFTSPSDGTEYTDDTDLSDNSAVVNIAAGTTSASFSSLLGSTQYYFKIFPYNGTGSQRNYKTDGTPTNVSATTLTALSAEPTNYPTNFNQGTINSSSIQLTWTTAVAGAQAPSGYLLIGSTNSNITSPSDGTVYTDDATLSDTYAVVNLSSSTTTYTFSSLPSATNYSFKIFPYNGNGASRNYKTDGAPPSQSGTTTGSVVSGPSVVVNEYYNSTAQSGEWVELLVLQDNLDMRGMKLQDYSTAGALQSGAAITFTTSSLWSSVAKGTFIVILASGNTQTEDTNPADKLIIVSGTNSTYFSGGSGFNVGASADALEIVNSIGTHIHSLSHGSKPGSIATLASPTANSTTTISTGSIRFSNVNAIANFSSDASTTAGATATQGAANDATEATFIANGMPVELTIFTAREVNGVVQLRWGTATEVNNQGFEIQRKLKDKSQNDWQSLGFVSGHGSVNVPQSYTFSDATVRGTAVYRLKQIDRDGGFEYSPEVEATVTAAASFALGQNFPNPFNPTSRIRYHTPAAGPVTLIVYNALGQAVQTLIDGVLPAGEHEVVLSAAGLSSGAYFYRLTTGLQSAARTFTVMK